MKTVWKIVGIYLLLTVRGDILYKIKYVDEHVEVFSKVTEQFLFSADTEQEAEQELKED